MYMQVHCKEVHRCQKCQVLAQVKSNLSNRKAADFPPVVVPWPSNCLRVDLLFSYGIPLQIMISFPSTCKIRYVQVTRCSPMIVGTLGKLGFVLPYLSNRLNDTWVLCKHGIVSLASYSKGSLKEYHEGTQKIDKD